MRSDEWLAGFEAAKARAAQILVHAAEAGSPHNAGIRLKAADVIRGMLPPTETTETRARAETQRKADHG